MEEKEEPKEKQEEQPKPIPYERFKEVNDKANELEETTKELEGKLTSVMEQLEAKEKEAQKKLEEKEKEKLTATELLQKQIDQLENSFTAEQEKRMRLEVASEHDIPTALIGRLQGDTQEQLAQDAENLKQFLKEDKKPPGSPPVPKGGKTEKIDIAGKSPAEIRKLTKEGKI